MFWISATNSNGFQPGQWFPVVGVSLHAGKPCYEVAIIYPIDGGAIMLDLWPIYDPSDQYKFHEDGT